MNRRDQLFVSLVVACLAMPVAAQASSIWHPASGEAGVTYHPEHFKSKTRAEVIAELEAARKDGTLLLIQRGAPLPAKSVSPGKTNLQPIGELRNETPRERRPPQLSTPGG